MENKILTPEQYAAELRAENEGAANDTLREYSKRKIKSRDQVKRKGKTLAILRKELEVSGRIVRRGKAKLSRHFAENPLDFTTSPESIELNELFAIHADILLPSQPIQTNWRKRPRIRKPNNADIAAVNTVDPDSI